MRLFGGLSIGKGGLRAGISRRGNLWVGGRTSAGPLYAGVLAGGRSSSSGRRNSLTGTVAAIRISKRNRKKLTLEAQLTDGRQVALTFYRDGAEVLTDMLTEKQ